MAVPTDLSLFSIAEPPRRFGELEAALGIRFTDSALTHHDVGHFFAPPPGDGSDANLSGEIASLSARYAWDPHHEHPIRTIHALRGRSLESYSIRFTRGRAAREAMLRERYGEPITAREPRDGGAAIERRVYGPFYTSEGADDAFTLSWYAKAPDWAVARADASARERFFRQLEASLRDAKTRADAAEIASSPPLGAGVVVTGATDCDGWDLELKPPMGALDLARFLGWTNPIGETVGIHRTSWRITLQAGSGARGLETRTPAAGAWRFEARLDAAPTGGEIAGAHPGPIAYCRLDAKDVVRRIRIELDR